MTFLLILQQAQSAALLDVKPDLAKGFQAVKSPLAKRQETFVNLMADDDDIIVTTSSDTEATEENDTEVPQKRNERKEIQVNLIESLANNAEDDTEDDLNTATETFNTTSNDYWETTSPIFQVSAELTKPAVSCEVEAQTLQKAVTLEAQATTLQTNPTEASTAYQETTDKTITTLIGGDETTEAEIAFRLATTEAA